MQKLTDGPDHQIIHCDVSINDIRLFVPQSLRRQVFNVFHNMAHLSGRTTGKIIPNCYVWSSIKKDVNLWACTSVPYQKSKIGRHIHAQPGSFTDPDRRFDHVYIDLVGQMPESEGFRYCMTMVDRFTRWPEAAPIMDITATTIANTFSSNWISRFGCPKIVTTDQGLQFESDLYTALLNLVGGKRVRTTAYHLATNGFVERWHRTIKEAIMCHQNDQWNKILPTVLLGLRSCYKEDFKTSPAERLYRYTFRIYDEFFTHEDPPQDPNFFLEEFLIYMRNVKPVPAAYHCHQKNFWNKDLATCSHVFLRLDNIRRPFCY